MQERARFCSIGPEESEAGMNSLFLSVLIPAPGSPAPAPAAVLPGDVLQPTGAPAAASPVLPYRCPFMVRDHPVVLQNSAPAASSFSEEAVRLTA